MKIPISSYVKLDVLRLIETRLLVQASSGGGKSMTLRTILEATHGHVPHIILDPEGEFSTLREKYDYILAGKDGDIPVDTRTASLFARKMLELNASVIIDLYELKHNDKHRFVRLFLEALVDAPKDLWGPRLVVLDEAHQFCPEKGAGTSEAWETVIDLCEKGRKRGLGAILATQRLSKLNKDAAAECQNKIIGLANIDIDRQRSANELGFNRKEDVISLRDMEPGEFYCIGPALCRSVIKTQMNVAITSHPKIGKRLTRKPVASKKILHLLDKLVDLPKEAENELKTVDDLRAEVSRLNKELRKVPIPKAVETKVDETKIRNEIARQFERSVLDWQKGVESKLKNAVASAFPDVWQPPVPIIRDVITNSLRRTFQQAVIKTVPEPAKVVQKLDMGDTQLGPSEQKILGFLLLNPDKAYTKSQIGPMVKMQWKGGSFRTYVSRLRSKGFVTGSNSIQITDQGQQTARELGIRPPDNLRAGLEGWLDKLSGNIRKIYEVLLSDHSRVWSMDEIAKHADMECTGGSFRTYVSRLCTIGLAVKQDGGLQLNPEVRNL